MSAAHFMDTAKIVSDIEANCEMQRGHANPREVAAFVRKLQGLGITVTNGAEYIALAEYTPPARQDPDPFTGTPAEVYAKVEQIGLHESNSGKISGHWREYVVHAGRAILATMREEVDTYITTLQPTFDQAAQAVAGALREGLTVNTTDAWLTEEGTVEQITAWRAARDAAVTLDKIAAVRIELSAWLDVPPQQNNKGYDSIISDYTPAFVKTASPYIFTNEPVSTLQVNRRWLDLQNAEGTALHLGTIADLKARPNPDGR
ncbi:hypothetical protein [Brachybacterium sp. p3-SID957]|uniref:hypothetical protein n=1 Tax=Brachybacterium sp. p3-SID957 TaxID=2916049 RepID=UPI00223B4D69|nr:hypothetical protein [Brachybacterium sp. p3-SID957]MCT1776767.1 hypothetical protein [Brachybacterium sp. p3-SID957]